MGCRVIDNEAYTALQEEKGTGGQGDKGKRETVKRREKRESVPMSVCVDASISFR